MNKKLIQQVFTSAKIAGKNMQKLSSKQRQKLEKSWDVEHAYYSSVLEGSKLDRKEFDELAKAVQ